MARGKKAVAVRWQAPWGVVKNWFQIHRSPAQKQLRRACEGGVGDLENIKKIWVEADGSKNVRQGGNGNAEGATSGGCVLSENQKVTKRRTQRIAEQGINPRSVWTSSATQTMPTEQGGYDLHPGQRAGTQQGTRQGEQGINEEADIRQSSTSGKRKKTYAPEKRHCRAKEKTPQPEGCNSLVKGSSRVKEMEG